MPRYTSHIYVKPTQELFSFLQSHPLLSTGLFYLRHSASEDVRDIIQNGLPNDGLMIVREVCDHRSSYQNEADVHKSVGAPILSWWDLQGGQDIQVIPPDHIPTLGFATIYDNYETNPPPPIEFLRFLKHLNATYETTIAFYHHYTAYEDRLADCEYAWIFDKQDIVYIRHVDEPYKTILYTAGDKPQMIHDKSTNDQPILHFVMEKFGITLSQSSDQPYFSDFNWEKCRFDTRTPLTESSQQHEPQSPSVKTLHKGKQKPRSHSDKRGAKSQGLKTSDGSDLPEANQGLDLHGILAALGERALSSNWLGNNIECLGESAPELYSYTDHEQTITGYDLLRITSGIYQTIEGDFKAFDQGSTSHWFYIRAWDGGGFYIEVNDPELKERLKNQFQAVEDIEEMHHHYEGLFVPCYH